MDKKFFVERNGKIVTAEYNKERNYRLEFANDNNAETFVRGIHIAQEEIEKTGCLKENTVSLSFEPKERVFTITFEIKKERMKVNPKLSTEKETYDLYRDLKQEILRHRKSHI